MFRRAVFIAQLAMFTGFIICAASEHDKCENFDKICGFMVEENADVDNEVMALVFEFAEITFLADKAIDQADIDSSIRSEMRSCGSLKEAFALLNHINVSNPREDGDPRMGPTDHLAENLKMSKFVVFYAEGDIFRYCWFKPAFLNFPTATESSDMQECIDTFKTDGYMEVKMNCRRFSISCTENNYSKPAKIFLKGYN